MQLSIFILISLAMLTLQCNQRPRQVAANSTSQPQQINPSHSESENKECDFSSFKPFKIGMMQAPAVSLPKPAYPAEAKEQKIEGRVIIKTLINLHSGEVVQACILEGNEILGAAAKDAALKAKFSPDWGNNKYLSERYEYLEGNLTYNFVSQ